MTWPADAFAAAGALAGADGPSLKYCKKIVTAAMTDSAISSMTLLRSAPSFISVYRLIRLSVDPLIG
jgi:hypothetical protein